MGAYCARISNSQKKKPFFNQDQESMNSRFRIDPNLDLPYRHYIHKNYYIASSLPHSVCQYHSNRKIKISGSIEQSSIMKRRILVHSPLLLQTTASISN